MHIQRRCSQKRFRPVQNWTWSNFYLRSLPIPNFKNGLETLLGHDAKQIHSICQNFDLDEFEVDSLRHEFDQVEKMCFIWEKSNFGQVEIFL